jgi:hypothetical protein
LNGDVNGNMDRLVVNAVQVSLQPVSGDAVRDPVKTGQFLTLIRIKGLG